jgi:DNA-binding CsgD family transcriptional regulator/tetratricopeptide (TPR) repeat protein
MSAVVGRERELTEISSFLASVPSGPAALVIEGEPGIGKTTVWREAVRLAEADGFQVVSCRPAESEAKLSFSALADLVDPFDEDRLDELPAPQRRALDVALLRVSPGDSPPDARAIGAAFRSLLVSAAAERPVLVAVDDAQWLDSGSAAAIEFAARRLAGPVGLLATRRPGGALDSVQAGDTPLALRPLSLAAIHHIIRDELGSVTPRPLLARVHETAGGNPFYALQLARVALSADVPAGAPLPLPEDLSELLRRRVASVEPETHELLLTVAAAAAPTRTLLEQVHGEIGPALEEAEEARLVDAGDRDVRFVHPLYASAVYASVGNEHRRRVHARLAEAVDEAEEQARHLALAATPPDEQAAARIHEAARTVAARGTYAAAADLVEEAIRLGDDSSEAAVERKVDLGQYLYFSGNATQAFEALNGVENWAELPVQMQIDGLISLMDAVYWTAAGHAAVELGEQLLERVSEPQVRGIVHVKISSYLEFDMARALEHADAALELVEPLGDAADPKIVSSALGMQARSRLALGLGLDHGAIERAITLEPGGYVDRSYGQWLKYVDDFDGSRERLQKHLREYEETGEDVSIPNALQQLATTECWAGNLNAAARYAERACGAADEMEITAVGPYRIRAIVEAHRGNEEQVRLIAERLYGEGWDPTILQHLEIAMGLLEHSLGNHEAADPHLRAAIELAEAAGQLEPGVHRVHGDAAEVALALGDAARAREIAELLEEHGRRTDHRWSAAVGARTRALLLADEGDLDAALAAIGEALAIQEGLPMPYELGRTFLVKGQIERRARHRRESRASLEQARAIFEEIGAKLWAQRAADELKRIPIRRGASDELTGAEHRVAKLVATGLTNKEVAQALFVSPKTVEATLSRVYGKLGIRSRAELGARMAEGSTAAKT